MGYREGEADRPFEEKNKVSIKKKKTDIIIHPSKEQFIYGNCASVAICSAFGIEWRAFKTICALMKMDISEGLSFFECKKLINRLSSSYDTKIEYIPNYAKVKYYQMLLLLNKGKYIVMFHNHLSYAENGEVFDGYYQGSEKAKFYIPTGWWKID